MADPNFVVMCVVGAVLGLIVGTIPHRSISGTPYDLKQELKFGIAFAAIAWILGLIIYSARRSTPWPHPVLVIVLVVQFLAGYLQGTIYMAAAAALCVAWLQKMVTLVGVLRFSRPWLI